jgi:putative peptidoglycan lipid II flippase
VESIIAKKGPPRETEIRVFYLQALEEEKNLELPFPSTSVGNTFFSDVCLENIGATVRFHVRLLAGEELPAMIRGQKGRLKLNGKEISGWAPLRADDRIEVEGRGYIFKSYREKTRENGHEDMTVGGGGSPASLAARLVGFGREIAAAALFGAGQATDLFAAALTLVGFLRRPLGAKAMRSAFLPIFARLFRRGPRRKAWEAASSMTLLTLLLALAAAAAGLLLAPLLVGWLFPGFAAQGTAAAAAKMMRILLPGLVLGTLAALAVATLRVFARSAAADASLLLFAAASLLGVFLLRPGSGFYALAWAVIFAGLLQLLFLLPFLAKTLARPALEFHVRPATRADSPVARKYASMLAPVAGGSMLAGGPSLVEKFVASSLRVGSISYLYFATEIIRLPFALVSRAIGRAVQRDVHGSAALFDRERKERVLVDGVRDTLFLLAPLSILMLTLANPIVSLLLERSNFSAQAVSRTALALQFYAIGLCGWGIHALTARIFAARLEERTTRRLDLALLALHLPLAVWLARTPLRFAGIALATSIAYTAFALVRVAVLQSRLRREGTAAVGAEMLAAAGKTLSACLMMVIAIIEAKFVFNRIQFASRTLENVIFFVSLTFMGTAVYFLSSLLLKNTGILIFKKKGGADRRPVPLSLLSPFKFLEAVSANPDFYKAEYRYKVSLYLSSPSWEVRNVGIKLIGLFRDKGKASYLVDMLGAGQGNGFMRRNALHALKAINPWNEEIKELMLRLLKDGYFEVRSAALDYLAQNISESEYGQLRPLVLRRLKRGSSEEKIACLRLAARKGGCEDLPQLQRLYLHSSSLVREELLELLYSFYRRNLMPGEEIKRQVQQVLVTSNHLTPEFRIKSIINRIYREIDHP